MSSADSIILSTEEIIKLCKEIDFHHPVIVITISWTDSLIDIGYSLDPTRVEIFSECHVLEKGLSEQQFFQDLISKLQQLVLIELEVFLCVLDSDKIVFKSKRCSSLLGKVADLQNKKITELTKIAFNNDLDGSVEVYFFDIDRNAFNNTKMLITNMLITNNYHNPEATNVLLTKLIKGANEFNFLKKIGFIGILSGDDHSSVKRSIEKIYRVLLKRIKTATDESNIVDSLTKEEVISKFFSDDKVSKSEEPPPGRVLRNLRSRQNFVDLTTVEEETVDDEVSSEIFCLCCSDIDQSLEDSQCTHSETACDCIYDRRRFLKKFSNPVGLERWFGICDFSIYPDDYELEEQQTHGEMERELPFLSEKKESASSKVNKNDKWPETPVRNSSEDLETTPDLHKKWLASDSSVSRNSAFLSRNSSSFSPQMRREMTTYKDLKIKIDVKPRLFEKEVYEKEFSKKYATPSLPKFKNDFVIPKKTNQSPKPRPSSSVLEYSPPADKIRSRPPIRPSSSTFERNINRLTHQTRFDGSELISKILRLPIGSSTPSGYDPRSLAKRPLLSSVQATPLLKNKNDVIVIVDDEEEGSKSQENRENNDLNNNCHEIKKRKLYENVPDESLNNTYINRIFKTKQPKRNQFNDRFGSS